MVSPPRCSSVGGAYCGIRHGVRGNCSTSHLRETQHGPHLCSPCSEGPVAAGSRYTSLPEGAEWKSVEARFVAGGLGHEAETPVSGLELKAWDAGLGRWAWPVAAGHGVEGEEPVLGEVVWSTDEPRVMRRLVFGSRKTLNFTIVPVAHAGAKTSKVVADYAEVRVVYDLGGGE